MAPAPSVVKAPTSRDIADLNPASLLIDKKKKASLPDSTVAQLKAVEKKIKERNAPFFATYDSIYKWTVPLNTSGVAAPSSGAKPGFTGASDNNLTAVGNSSAEQTKMQASMRDLRAMMADYRERRKTDVADVLAVIPDAQKKAATDLLTSQDGDLDKLLNPRP
jgi:hypothetical protein